MNKFWKQVLVVSLFISKCNYCIKIRQQSEKYLQVDTTVTFAINYAWSLSWFIVVMEIQNICWKWNCKNTHYHICINSVIAGMHFTSYMYYYFKIDGNLHSYFLHGFNTVHPGEYWTLYKSNQKVIIIVLSLTLVIMNKLKRSKYGIYVKLMHKIQL